MLASKTNVSCGCRAQVFPTVLEESSDEDADDGVISIADLFTDIDNADDSITVRIQSNDNISIASINASCGPRTCPTSSKMAKDRRKPVRGPTLYAYCFKFNITN